MLTAEEVDRLVDAIVDPDPRYAALRTNGRYRALVFMGCWLGPRWNEAIGLRVCDINPLRKELTFGRAVVNQNGNTTFIEKMSKTEDARTLPVPGPVMDVLLEHLRVYRPGAGREDNGKVSRAVVVDIEDITTESLLCRDMMHPFALGWQHDYVVARVEGQPILITRYFICPVWLPRHESSVTTNPRHQDVGAEARESALQRLGATSRRSSVATRRRASRSCGRRTRCAGPPGAMSTAWRQCRGSGTLPSASCGTRRGMGKSWVVAAG